MRILLVEDDEFLRDALKDTLISIGCSVTEANDGTVALDLFERGTFDAIITDNDMAHLCGLPLIQEIRRSSQVPILLMTAGNITQEIAMNVGANSFLRKPFDLRELELFIFQIELSNSIRAANTGA